MKKLVVYINDGTPKLPWLTNEEREALGVVPYNFTTIAYDFETKRVLGKLEGTELPTEGYELPTSLDGFSDLPTRTQITKAQVVEAFYTKDEENKILRDMLAGRNDAAFQEYDALVNSIPG